MADGIPELGRREFEKRQEASEYAKVFQSLIDRMKLRQWCIEQVKGLAFASSEDMVKAAQQVFDFCCEDIEAWLARHEA